MVFIVFWWCFFQKWSLIFQTYHEVVDQIYYKVTHLEPWEKGSRKASGQTGMCGGVRGVGAGGIVSSAYCLLYKLFTLKLTRKQVTGLINHADSPYIRGLGFMYIRWVLFVIMDISIIHYSLYLNFFSRIGIRNHRKISCHGLKTT